MSALDTPEETVAISALDRGGLMHKILERFIKESDTPPPDQGWTPEDRTHLTLITHQEFARVETEALPANPSYGSSTKKKFSPTSIPSSKRTPT